MTRPSSREEEEDGSDMSASSGARSPSPTSRNKAGETAAAPKRSIGARAIAASTRLHESPQRNT